MPLPIAHGLLGASIVAAIHPKPFDRYCLPLVAGAILANAPDLDFVAVIALHNGTFHRGPSHSLTVAFIACLIFILFLGKQRIRIALAFGLAFASHCLLDYATTLHGGGVKLLWPFTSTRYGLRLISFSELPSRLPAIEICKDLVLEFLIFSPLLLFLIYLRRHLWVSRWKA